MLEVSRKPDKVISGCFKTCSFLPGEEFTNGDAVLTEKLVKLRQRQQLLGSSMLNKKL